MSGEKKNEDYVLLDVNITCFLPQWLLIIEEQNKP